MGFVFISTADQNMNSQRSLPPEFFLGQAVGEG